MYAEIGNFFLYLSLISLLFVITNFIFPIKYKANIMLYSWGITTISTIISFLCLVICYVISDYSVLNVLYNSHELKPIIYKIAGSWSNHEGSMLLWIISITIPTFLFAIIANDNIPVKNLTLFFQATLGFLFVIYTLFTSNPFERIIPAPIRGLGMNPLLQDIGVSFHPPILYLGYVGFSLPFSSALAVLILKDKNQWIKSIRPWILYAWSFLTLGIGSGAWWAYRELGWGGFWFWDPVENASLMPWITAIALIHSIRFSEDSKLQLNWSILLTIITFTLVMIGTFIVRSGAIASVHSFAQDPKRGFFILISIFLISGFALLLYAVNFKKLCKDNAASSFSNKYILLNNIVLSLIAIIVSLGTIYPMFMEVFFRKYLIIDSNYYNSLITPITVLLVILCTLGTNDIFKIFAKKGKVISFVISIITTFIIVYYFKINKLYSVLGIYCSILLFIISLTLIFKLRKLQILPVSIAHSGFAILIFSISMFYGLKDEKMSVLELNEKMIFRNLDIKLENVIYKTESNYLTKTAVISVNDDLNIYPEIRFYPIEKQQTVEVDMISNFFYDIYFSINSPDDSKKIMLNVQYNPMINFIWISCILICSSGFIAIILKKIK